MNGKNAFCGSFSCPTRTKPAFHHISPLVSPERRPKSTQKKKHRTKNKRIPKTIPHPKSTIHIDKYTTIPWFYDTGKGGQSNNDTEVTAATKLSKWPWPMPARWIPSRQQLQGPWRPWPRRMWCWRHTGDVEKEVDVKEGAMSQAEIYDFWGSNCFLSSVHDLFFGRIQMMHTFSMGKGLRSCSFGMCSSFGLHGMLEVASRHRRNWLG